jgi:hypothetical protein
MAASHSIWIRDRIGNAEIESVLGSRWRFERNEYGWVIPLAPGQVIQVEKDDAEDMPSDMIDAARRAMRERRSPKGRVVVLFDERVEMERNLVWYIGQAFGARWPAVLDNHAGTMWVMATNPLKTISY